MPTYLVRRRGIAANAKELDAALTRLRSLEDSPSLRARVLHSYALREGDGHFGLLCVVAAEDLLAVHEHARASLLPAEEAASEITPVLGRIVFQQGAMSDPLRPSQAASA